MRKFNFYSFIHNNIFFKENLILKFKLKHEIIKFTKDTNVSFQLLLLFLVNYVKNESIVHNLTLLR